MKQRLFLVYSWVVIALVASTFLLVLASWFASLYGLTVHNLLSLEGVRWLLRLSLKSVGESFPFLSLLLICMGLGLLYYSSWLSAVNQIFHKKYRLLSYKQRWGIQISSIVGAVFLLLLFWLIFSSSGGLLSVTGTFAHSPLLEGWTLLFGLACLLISGVYGWVTGSFRHFQDVVAAMIKGVQVAVPLFILLFILLNFIRIYQYVF